MSEKNRASLFSALGPPPQQAAPAHSAESHAEFASVKQRLDSLEKNLLSAFEARSAELRSMPPPPKDTAAQERLAALEERLLRIEGLCGANAEEVKAISASGEQVKAGLDALDKALKDQRKGSELDRRMFHRLEKAWSGMEDFRSRLNEELSEAVARAVRAVPAPVPAEQISAMLARETGAALKKAFLKTEDLLEKSRAAGAKAEKRLDGLEKSLESVTSGISEAVSGRETSERQLLLSLREALAREMQAAQGRISVSLEEFRKSSDASLRSLRSESAAVAAESEVLLKTLRSESVSAAEETKAILKGFLALQERAAAESERRAAELKESLQNRLAALEEALPALVRKEGDVLLEELRLSEARTLGELESFRAGVSEKIGSAAADFFPVAAGKCVAAVRDAALNDTELVRFRRIMGRLEILLSEMGKFVNEFSSADLGGSLGVRGQLLRRHFSYFSAAFSELDSLLKEFPRAADGAGK